MASQVVELDIFKQFVSLAPNFAGITIETIEPGPNPPDVICTGASRKIGVELSEWLDRQQIAREKPRYARETVLRKAINSSAVAPPEHIGSVQLFARDGVRLKPADLSAFRDELYATIKRFDDKWLTLRDHDHPHGVASRDFTGAPLVQKYLTGLLFTSRKFRTPVTGTAWINFFPRGGPFSPETARGALDQTLSRKTAKYGTLRGDAKLDDLYLLLYYDQAHFFNTPFDSPGYGFREIAARLTRIAAKDHGMFDKIFLFIPAKKVVAQIFS